MALTTIDNGLLDAMCQNMSERMCAYLCGNELMHGNTLQEGLELSSMCLEVQGSEQSGAGNKQDIKRDKKGVC